MGTEHHISALAFFFFFFTFFFVLVFICHNIKIRKVSICKKNKKKYFHLNFCALSIVLEYKCICIETCKGLLGKGAFW